MMRQLGLGRLRKLPADAPISFIRQTWRRRIGRDDMDRRTYEFCVLAELRDRLRAGDMWVEGSRRYRAVEQQLIPAPVFAAMREVGPLPVPLPDTAAEWLSERRAQLARRLADPVRVARQIGEHRLRAGERRFGIDDPVLFADRGQVSQEGAAVGESCETAIELKPSRLVQRHQPGQEQAAEQLAEHAHRQQERGA